MNDNLHFIVYPGHNGGIAIQFFDSDSTNEVKITLPEEKIRGLYFKLAEFICDKKFTELKICIGEFAENCPEFSESYFESSKLLYSVYCNFWEIDTKEITKHQFFREFKRIYKNISYKQKRISLDEPPLLVFDGVRIKK